jgi:phosphonate degradation associated HDIG domain protein
MSASSVDEVLALYERLGRERYDEVVTQLDHALQSAALARADGASDALVAAALLHDVGHLLDLDRRAGSTDADLRHEVTGAAWLRPLLGPAVTAPIALHVRAKRYLVAVDDGYAATLSAGSTRSLERQGGPMGDDEVAAFGALAGAADAIRLRRWDDSAKLLDADVPPLEAHRALLERLAASR